MLYERSIDVSSHTILWQVANLASHDTQSTAQLSVLTDYLSKYYSHDQRTCIYEAAILPMLKARVEWIKLDILEISFYPNIYFIHSF